MNDGSSSNHPYAWAAMAATSRRLPVTIRGSGAKDAPTVRRPLARKLPTQSAAPWPNPAWRATQVVGPPRAAVAMSLCDFTGLAMRPSRPTRGVREEGRRSLADARLSEASWRTSACSPSFPGAEARNAFCRMASVLERARSCDEADGQRGRIATHAELTTATVAPGVLVVPTIALRAAAASPLPIHINEPAAH